MPKELGESKFTTALQAHLDKDEQLKHWAFGTKPPNLFLVPLILIASTFVAFLVVWVSQVLTAPGPFDFIIFLLFWVGAAGVLWTAMRKDYVFGLTDRRLIVLRVSPWGLGKSISIKEVMKHQLDHLPPIETSDNSSRTVLKIQDSQKPVIAKFYHSRMVAKIFNPAMAAPENQVHAKAIVAALSAK